MVPLGINIEFVQSLISFWIRDIGNMSGFFDAVGRSQYLNSDVRIRTVHWKRKKYHNQKVKKLFFRIRILITGKKELQVKIIFYKNFFEKKIFNKFYQIVPFGINIEFVQSFIPFWIRGIGNMSGFFDAVGRSQYLNSDVRIRTVH